MLLLDSLEMLVTSDPIAEVDAALIEAAARLHAARTGGRTRDAEVLTQWIDIRLDQRFAFRRDAGSATGYLHDRT